MGGPRAFDAHGGGEAVMTFLEPQRLWWLLLIVLLVGAYVLSQRQRREYTVRFTNLELLDQVAPKRPD
ncbi:BatA domain-containing protein, partial [Nocardiopsis alba]|uniref:BatA domain-containing protein n=1 Tax=Nocardiopsis alba TaxID=53437 RepID=UPI003F4D4175